MMLLSKAAKSRRTSSRYCLRSSQILFLSRSVAAASSSAAEASGGGVGGSVGTTVRREVGPRSRLTMRLNGFSSTFRSRAL